MIRWIIILMTQTPAPWLEEMSFETVLRFKTLPYKNIDKIIVQKSRIDYTQSKLGNEIT